MDLAPNTTLGHYRLIEKIGEGGMGVVWRAADTTLGREVAIKILPDLFADDADRLARFEREAKLLASLNHPGIATIHGLHQADGVRFLAMELAAGTDLAKRLEAGPMPVDEALGIALRIAEALEVAHEHGIVHRDLKPANVQIAPDGGVKILDFGLAKAYEPDPARPGSSAMSMSPTLTTPAATRLGMILGTAAYMSPEQAKGRAVDRRADIWAFGCVLYEMLAGRRPFQGEGVSEVLAAVIMAPIDFGPLPAGVPPRVQRLLRRCLEKDPKRRLRDIGEARLALEETLSGAPDDAAPAVATTKPNGKTVLAAIVAAVVGALLTAGAFWTFARHPAPAPVRRFQIAAKGPFRSVDVAPLVAIAPDGHAVAVVEGGKLLVRRLDRIDPLVISTSMEPVVVFWSPDSAFVGYIAGTRMFKVPADGGDGILISDLHMPISGGVSASWCPDGHIVLTSGEAGVFRAPALGGDLTPYIPLLEGKEADLHDVTCLPDNTVMFVPHLVKGRPNGLILYDGKDRKEIFHLAPDQDIWFPSYSPTGHILYRRQPTNGGIWALPFSLSRHEATGEPFLVAAAGDVPSVSNDGTLLHVRGSASFATQMVWVDRNGKEIGPIGPPQEQWPFPEIAPDGKHVAISAMENDVSDIWIHDVERGTRTRMSTPTVSYSSQAWSPDGRSIVFAEGTSAPLTLKTKAADGSGEAVALGTGWSASYYDQGRQIVYADQAKDGAFHLWRRSADGKTPPVSVLTATQSQTWPRVSPDGRFLAYSSDETGTDEVYVKRFPDGEGKWQVSNGGGYWPRWGKSGRHLYYVKADDVMDVEVSTSPDLHLGAPHVLFARPPLRRGLIFGWPAGFDVSAQEDRFVICRPSGNEGDLSGLIVVQNWASEFTAAR